jgi:hypothetical protein
MGVNFYQRCILGVSFVGKSIKNVASEEQYRYEPRFNPRTGEKTEPERIITRRAEYNYLVLDKEFDELEYVEFDDLDVIYEPEEDMIYIGKRIGHLKDYGRVDLLTGSVWLEHLVKEAHAVAEKLGMDVDKLSLHFIASAG